MVRSYIWSDYKRIQDEIIRIRLEIQKAKGSRRVELCTVLQDMYEMEAEHKEFLGA